MTILHVFFSTFPCPSPFHPPTHNIDRRSHPSPLRKICAPTLLILLRNRPPVPAIISKRNRVIVDRLIEHHGFPLARVRVNVSISYYNNKSERKLPSLPLDKNYHPFVSYLLLLLLLFKVAPLNVEDVHGYVKSKLYRLTGDWVGIITLSIDRRNRFGSNSRARNLSPNFSFLTR